MSVLDRKLRRDLFAARGLLLAIIGIIALGISSFVSMLSAYHNLTEAQTSYYHRCRMADFWIDLKKAPTEEALDLVEIPGVQEARSIIVFDVVVDLDDTPKPISGRVLSLPESPQPVINGIVVRRGGYFTNRRREEVIINDKFAIEHGIHPGDRIRLILNNRREELFVVGTAISSEFVYLMSPGSIVPDPANFGVFYVKRRFAEEAFDFEGATNRIVGLLDPRYRDRPDRLLDRMEDRLDAFGVVATTPRRLQESHYVLDNEIRSLEKTATVLPTIFLSVAALILNVLMSRMTEQQRTIVGTLKALGYSNPFIFWHYAKFGLSVGLVGGIAGDALGYFMAAGFTEIYTYYFEFPRLVNRAYPGLWMIGVGIGLAFAMLGALRGVRGVLRLGPAEAMRPKPPEVGRRILLERWTWLWRRMSLTWQISIREIFRNRVRSASGVFAAMMGSAILMTTFYQRDSAFHMVDFQFDKILRSDYEIALKDVRNDGSIWEAEDFPGVDRVEPLADVPVTFRHGRHEKRGSVTGLVPQARLTAPRDERGRITPVPSHGLLLSKKLAEILRAPVGSDLILEPVRGDRRPRTAPVVGIVDSYFGLQAYADSDYLARLVDEEALVTSLQIEAQPDYRQQREFHRELKRLPALEGVRDVRGQKKALVDILLGSLIFSLIIMIGFAGVIFFGSILNSSLISLAERQREIATYRVIGYSPREIGRIFLRESLILNLTGALLGLPLGYALSMGVAEIMDTEIFRFPRVIHPISYVWPVVAALIFTLAAHVIVRRSIDRMHWQDALKLKE